MKRKPLALAPRPTEVLLGHHRVWLQGIRPNTRKCGRLPVKEYRLAAFTDNTGSS